MNEKTNEQIAREAYIENMVNDAEPLQEEQEGQAESQNAVTVTDETTSLKGLLSIIPIVLQSANYKKTADVWNALAIENLSNALIPVLRKYAWGQRVIEFLRTGSGVEEAALLFAAWPLALSTYNAVQEDKAEFEKEVKSVDEQKTDYPPLDIGGPNVFGTNRK